MPLQFSLILPASQARSEERRLRRSLLQATSASILSLTAAAAVVTIPDRGAQALTCSFASASFTGCSYGAAWPGDPGSTIPPGPSSVPSVAAPIEGQWLETNIQYNKTSYYYPTDKQIWFFDAPSVGFGDIEFYWIDVTKNGDWRIPPDPASIDQWQVDVDFNPDLLDDDGPSVFRYAIRTIAEQPFHDVSLQAVLTSPSIAANFVNKQVWAGSLDAAGEPVCAPSGPPLVDLTVPPSPSGFDNAVNGLTVLCVEDTASVLSPSDTLDNYQNVFRQTPGPLPLLGAGAFFGYSRKLRSRIKASRSH